MTEYSLKPWDTHREDVISPEFIAAAKADPHDEIHPPPVGVKRVWQYINYATMTPRPLAE